MHLIRRLNPLWKLIGASSFALVGLWLLLPGSQVPARVSSAEKQGITLFCAASLRLPVEEIAQRYRQQYAVPLNIQYGGSQTLLSQIEIARQGDLFLAADQWYLQVAREKQLVDQVMAIARMKPVVVVARGNPRQITRWEHLLEHRVALANPALAAIGRETRELLTQAGKWDDLALHVTQSGVYKPTVGDVANDVQLGAVDAGVVWDAVARQTIGLEIIQLPELESGQGIVGLGLLSCSTHADEALRFARYLATSDQGREVFARMGYKPVAEGQRQHVDHPKSIEANRD